MEASRESVAFGPGRRHLSVGCTGAFGSATIIASGCRSSYWMVLGTIIFMWDWTGFDISTVLEGLSKGRYYASTCRTPCCVLPLLLLVSCPRYHRRIWFDANSGQMPFNRYRHIARVTDDNHLTTNFLAWVYSRTLLASYLCLICSYLRMIIHRY